MDEETLLCLLSRYNVPFLTWDTSRAPGSKTREDLLSEILTGDTVLALSSSGLLRKTTVAAIDIFYTDVFATLKLVEDRQVSTTGQVTRRHLETSIGEKLHRNEYPIAGARRALREELGISHPVKLDFKRVFEKGPLYSKSFPGIKSLFTLYLFEMNMPAHLFVPNGYTETQPKKTSYFVWKDIS